MPLPKSKTIAAIRQYSGYERFVLHEEHCETTIGPSMTVPDQTVSLEELLRRHTMGIPTTGMLEPQWSEEANHDSADLSKLNDLDLYDKQLVREAVESDIQRMKQTMADKKAARLARKEQEKREATEKANAGPSKKRNESPTPEGEGKLSESEE